MYQSAVYFYLPMQTIVEKNVTTVNLPLKGKIMQNTAKIILTLWEQQFKKKYGSEK